MDLVVFRQDFATVIPGGMDWIKGNVQHGAIVARFIWMNKRRERGEGKGVMTYKLIRFYGIHRPTDVPIWLYNTLTLLLDLCSWSYLWKGIPTAHPTGRNAEGIVRNEAENL